MISIMTHSLIATYLQNDSHSLGSLLLKLNQLKQWNSWLHALLPTNIPLQEHCQIVGLAGTSLIVIADNPHWVTRFRFFIPELLKQLQTYPDLKNIRSICCKVRPPLHSHSANKKQRRQPLIISSATAEVMQHTAKKIRHERLKKTLEKMAARGK